MPSLNCVSISVFFSVIFSLIISPRVLQAEVMEGRGVRRVRVK